MGRALPESSSSTGDTVQPYAVDETIFLRDWLVDMETGSFRNFVTKRAPIAPGTSGISAAPKWLRSSRRFGCLRQPTADPLINGDPTRGWSRGDRRRCCR